jgi:hypothetical protein
MVDNSNIGTAGKHCAYRNSCIYKLCKRRSGLLSERLHKCCRTMYGCHFCERIHAVCFRLYGWPTKLRSTDKLQLRFHDYLFYNPRILG